MKAMKGIYIIAHIFANRVLKRNLSAYSCKLTFITICYASNRCVPKNLMRMRCLAMSTLKVIFKIVCLLGDYQDATK